MVSVRPATVADLGDMHRVRMSVRENRLISTVLTEEDYARVLAAGRGWVAEVDGHIIGFAIANGLERSVWALFVEPSCEQQGVGRRLHDQMISWMASQPVECWWLTTEPGTRAERFYERAGWTRTGVTAAGEARFERPVTSGSPAGA
jgi:GNAT superfamily N-acetyltransferase